MKVFNKRNARYVVGGVSMLVSSAAMSLTLDFDYTYDSNNFFSAANSKSALNAAGSYFESILQDDLTAISSGGANHFDAVFANPGDGSIVTLNDYSVAANTLTIFVGGRSLGGGTLGQGGAGGYTVSGTTAFVDNVASRGEAGATQGANATDFAPWGGAITFNTNSVWYFDPDTSTTEPFAGQNDFYSVALHEIGHVLGIGTADSWDNLISGTDFTGSASKAVYGGNVPLSSGLGHWAEGTTSTIGGVGSQEAAMDPSINTGTRKVFTDLDNAGLSDVGWEVSTVPLPAGVWLFGTGLAALLLVSRRKAA